MENKPTYEEPQAQVDALRKALNDQLNDCINFDGGKLTDVIMENSSDILAVTPQNHLRELRAEAGRAGFVAGFNTCVNYEEMMDLQQLSNQYADQIRKGGAEW